MFNSMKASSDQNNKSLAFKLFKEMQEDNLEYTYRGNFTNKITDTILSLAETNLNNVDTPVKTKKRVYFIMVEGLQNVTRHQTPNTTDDLSAYPGLFVVQRKVHGYFITTGNVIEADSKEYLSTMIDKINSLNPEELKKYSLEILDQGEVSPKGGAGLGLVEIARRSNSKLLYDFKDINEKYLYFYMHTKIPNTDNIGDTQATEEDKNSLENIKELHKLLEEQNILLNFTGNFTQDTLINLLSIIEKQLQGTIILKMKVFNLMVEMLQNVVKHADNFKYKNVLGKHAIFYISENPDSIVFTTGNYIQNPKIEKLNNKIEKINNLEKDKLTEYYNKSLFNFEDNNDVHTGLGLIDIKMKSKNNLTYDFYKIDDEYSFFSLQVTITKMKNGIERFVSLADNDTPEIMLDAETGKMEFKGRSIPENAVTFYKPVNDWLREYALNPQENTEITFNLDYFNTASDKQIAKLMLAFEKISDKTNLRIIWLYHKGDYEMMNEGLKYKELTTLQIDLKEEE